MPEASWLLFTVASLVLIATPGQDMILVMSRSIAQGPAAGIATAAGVSLGLVGHTILATLGLGAILRTSAAFCGLETGRWRLPHLPGNRPASNERPGRVVHSKLEIPRGYGRAAKRHGYAPRTLDNSPDRRDCVCMRTHARLYRKHAGVNSRATPGAIGTAHKRAAPKPRFRPPRSGPSPC